MMMKTLQRFLLPFLFIFFLIHKVSGQVPDYSWAKQLGLTGSYSMPYVYADSYGYVYVSGHFSSTVDFDPGPGVFNMAPINGSCFLLKLNTAGNFIWAKQFGDTPGYASLPILEDSNANLYVYGTYSATADFDPGPAVFNLPNGNNSSLFILKLDSAGNFIWAKDIHGTGNYNGGFCIDHNNALIFTGSFASSVDFDPSSSQSFSMYASGSGDAFILKLDSGGSFMWAKQFAAVNSSGGGFVTVDSLNNIYTNGTFSGSVDFDPDNSSFNLTSHTGGPDIYVVKLNMNGDYVWAKSFGGTANDVPFSINLDANNNVYTGGYCTGSVDFDPGPATYTLAGYGSADIFVSKLDSAGNFGWAKRIGNSTDNENVSTVIDASGNIYLLNLFYLTLDCDPGSGVHSITGSGREAFILKLDSGGNFLWASQIMGSNNETPYTLAINNSGELYCAGTFLSDTLYFGSVVLISETPTNSTEDIFIAKIDVSTGLPIISQNASNIQILPNPFHNYASFVFNSISNYSKEDLKIFNTLGALVKEQTISGQSAIINREGLENGIYFIRVSGEDGKNWSGKVVVE